MRNSNPSTIGFPARQRAGWLCVGPDKNNDFGGKLLANAPAAISDGEKILQATFDSLITDNTPDKVQATTAITTTAVAAGRRAHLASHAAMTTAVPACQ